MIVLQLQESPAILKEHKIKCVNFPVNIFNNSLESSHTLFYVPLKLLVIPEVGEQSFEPVELLDKRIIKSSQQTNFRVLQIP